MYVQMLVIGIGTNDKDGSGWHDHATLRYTCHGTFHNSFNVIDNNQ